MSNPLPRNFLLVDTERFSDRDDVQQTYLRRMLYDVVDRTLQAAGVDRTLRLRADRGDSVMELIDPHVPLNVLLRTLLTEVPAQLRAINRLAASSAQLRLRVVLASGMVMIDEHEGWVGTDLNEACRLLDGEPLRAALRERTDDYALCVSPSVHSGIVRHNHPGIPAEEFHEVTVASKNGPLQAWLHGPLPTGAAAEPAAAPAPEAPRGPGRAGEGAESGGEGRPDPALIRFQGVNNGILAGHIDGNAVRADVVHGDIIFGDRR
ncbi:hypothetical protein ACQKM2_11130 [Streptomyces sp. NPDC004126]|uniref:hypothetical protein n=1 Tax=Streptomyces sp. NPDC004126 TaxID=3390695 RepID=UPI003CFCA5D6